MRNASTAVPDGKSPPSAASGVHALLAATGLKSAPDNLTAVSSILDSVVVGVMQIAPDGRVAYANAYARGMLQIGDKPLEELVLADFHPRLIWPDGNSIRYEEYPAIVCLRTGLPQGPMTIGFRGDDGATRWVTASVVPAFDASARVQAVIATFVDVTEHKRTEESLRQHKGQLEQHVAERTAELLSKNVELEAEVVERRRAEAALHEKQDTLVQLLETHERHRQLVAYEIHDTFVQDVIGALMYLDSYRDTRDVRQDAELARLDKAQSLLREAVQSARRMISGLRPPIIDERGIVAAIEYLISEWNAQGMQFDLQHDLQVERFTPVFESSVFRIVQEALTNVQRHSGVQRATVRLNQRGNMLYLEIHDQGAGFDPDQVRRGHFGLRGISERARLLGGALAIESALSRGTTIRVSLPIPPRDDRPVESHSGRWERD